MNTLTNEVTPILSQALAKRRQLSVESRVEVIIGTGSQDHSWRFHFFSGTRRSKMVSYFPGSGSTAPAAGPSPATVSSALREEPPVWYLTSVAIHARPSSRWVSQSLRNHSTWSQRTVSDLDLNVMLMPCSSHPVIAGCVLPHRPNPSKPAAYGRIATRMSAEDPVNAHTIPAATITAGKPNNKQFASPRAVGLMTGTSSPGRELVLVPISATLVSHTKIFRGSSYLASASAARA